jgi:choline dehydrogenase-like flavoprotein
MWRSGGLMATLGRTPIALAEGRCVGGSTEINSAIFQRADDEVIEYWAKANHIPDFSPQTLAPLYDRAAAVVNASFTPGSCGPPTEMLRRAGEAMGWKTTPLERGRRETSSPSNQISGFATGAKQSMCATLIPKTLGRGARLLADCRIDRLTMHGSRITGAVATARDEQGRRYRVSIEASQTFLCAGTTQTPAILQRSGIRKNIGCSFQVHPTIRVIATFREPLNAHEHDVPLVAITEFMPALRMGGSVFTLSSFALALAEDWPSRGKFMRHHAHCAMYYVMIRPDGVGRVRSVPGIAEPILTYTLTERDWRRLRDGLNMLACALLTSGATRVIPSLRGHQGWTRTGDVEPDLRYGLPQDRVALMTIHLFGSCPMGRDPDLFPIDPWGRLAGFEGVVVADGSVLPGAPGVNPQATIMALAYRATDYYLACRG